MKILTNKAFEEEVARRMREDRMRQELEEGMVRMQKQIEELRCVVDSMRYTKEKRND